MIATSLLLPFEIYELARHPSACEAAGIVVNIAIVVYLAHLLRRRVSRSLGLAATSASENPGKPTR